MKLTNIAAIDLGTNSFHLVVVRLKQGGNFEIIHKQREVVRIGVGKSKNVGLLPKEGIDRAMSVLRTFKEIADANDAKIFAVATSAIREASNGSIFIDEVKNQFGIEINVVSGFDEARLIYLGVLQGLDIYNKKVLLIDIGGGSTELLIAKKGKIEYAASVKLGAVRLTSKFFSYGGKFEKQKVNACRKYISSELRPVLRHIKRLGFNFAVGTAGTVQAVGNVIRSKNKPKEQAFVTLHNFSFSMSDLEKAASQIIKAKDTTELAEIAGLDPSRADIILAGTIILDEIFSKLKIKKLTISGYALREGIVLDAIEKLGGADEEKNKLKKLRYDSVLNLGRSYNFDLPHSNQVKKIVLSLFDETKQIHNLDNYHRELLEYAAMLHDIGYHISPAKHHKHSYYLIKNSDMHGFSQRETEIIANIARYHRKAVPRDGHENLQVLSEPDKSLVKKLASLLRIADGLEKTHAALIKDIKIRKEEKQYVMILRYLTTPPETELWTAKKRKKVFEDVFNVKMKIVLEKIEY